AYIDGHECPDIVKYYQKFFEAVSQLERLMSKWVDPECKIRTFPDLNNGEKEHIWVTHDKTTFYVYDGSYSMWGPLKDEQEEARIMMVLGANQDGYWDSKKLLEQVVWAVDIFERTHSECVGVFVFDNATSYKAFAKDALVASKMNLGPGRSVPKMQDTM
ncbi:17964_t:CDS:2, partial [Cetraspora pellucida]